MLSLSESAAPPYMLGLSPRPPLTYPFTLAPSKILIVSLSSLPSMFSVTTVPASFTVILSLPHLPTIPSTLAPFSTRMVSSPPLLRQLV